MNFISKIMEFYGIPLIHTIRKLHQLFMTHNIPYVIIGGLAVIRNGGYRTTHDIDILTLRDKWEILRKKEDGIELASKDLADVVLLVQNNKEKINTDFIKRLHPGVRKKFKKIVKKIIR